MGLLSPSPRGLKLLLTLDRLGFEEVVNHSRDLLVNLGLGNDLGKILQDQRPSGQIWQHVKNVGNVKASVSPYVNDEWRSVAKVGAIEEFARVVEFGPRRLPSRPSFHVARKGFVALGAFLQAPEEVEAIGVALRMVVDICRCGFLIANLGQVFR